ncbi:MAG: beta strand repeat-containing protein, partial [Hominicoprocola sp.]
MRKRTNKLLSLLLTLTMVLGMLPAMSLTAFAAEPGITLAGSDSSGEGWSYTASSQTLTLNNYDGGYIQGSGLSTLNLVLEGTNTITVDDANAKGIALGNNQNLNISGSGSLTINATGGSNLIYGIECNKFTMTSGTVTINANSSNMVYGVNANDSLSVTGGKLTANITGTSDGRGLYCKTGKLTVGSGAEVDVTVTNNGSNIMYGIYNEAYTESVTDNGDIELAGTVTVTRDSGSTGSGYVYGIANGGSNSNTDGVISITGGSVTVTNAYYGIIAFTKGHAAAFADVTISGGTVNVTSTTSDSLGIVSWNNGVTISGGTVTASTANKALWLADQDSTNKTGLVKITGDAKVSLTSAASKALIVQGDESNTSTRVHQINLSSGGSVTVKSTSSDETYRTHPVQGYFSLGSSTKITEGSFRSTPDGTNAGGGKLFQADSTTNQVVVAYSTPAPDTNSVSVNGHNFASPTKLYYKNGDSDTTNDSTDYNAHYDPTTGILELKNYSSGRIIIGGSVESDITIKLVGDNVISSDSQYGIVNSNGGDITITADSDATLTINVTDNSDYAHGIACDIAGSYASRSREITISGKAKVTVNATSTSSAVNDNAVGIFTGGKAAIVDDASFTAICKSSTPSGGLQSAAGIYGYSGVTINTTGKVDIDVSQCSGAYNYG